jgi:hypothetical protein
MSKKRKNFPEVTVVEKETLFQQFHREKPMVLRVEEFLLSEESKPVGKWERIKDLIPIIELINKIISFF